MLKKLLFYEEVLYQAMNWHINIIVDQKKLSKTKSLILLFLHYF